MVILPIQSVVYFVITLAMVAAVFFFAKDRIIPAVAADTPHVNRTAQQEQAVIDANTAGKDTQWQQAVTDLAIPGAALSISDWTPYHLQLQHSSPGTFEFDYPELDDSYMLVKPIGRPYVMLCLENPTRLRSVVLEGEGLNQSRLYVSYLNPETGVDDGSLIEIGTVQAGRKLTWDLEELGVTHAINTIRLTAQLVGTDRHVAITLIPAGDNN